MIIFFDRTSPWEGKTSIYAYIREKGDAVDDTLPDDEEFWAGSRIRWVAGGMDGVFAAGADSQNKDEIRKLVQLLAKHSRKPKFYTRKQLYSMIMSSNLIGMIDDVLDEVRKHPGMNPQKVFEEAVWMVEHAAHRNVVKFGIALLGLFPNEQVKELLLTIGAHEEFTLYAAVAILNGMENGNDVLFELAKRVHGWGKIHVVRRLEPSRQEIRDWLLRHGCQNNIMNEYLACVCARKGDLRGAVSAERVDEELFEGATIIVEALLNGGPAEDIDDYEHAPQVISDYVRLAGAMSVSVKHLYTLIRIRDFLAAEDDERWAKRLSSNWSGELKDGSLEACRKIIARPDWADVVIRAVQSGDWYGIRCAHALGLDVWDLLFAQLAENPMQEWLYFELMQSEDPVRIRKLVQFAEEKLPLGKIATGPAEEMGLGQEYEPHRCLDYVLQELHRHEGIGEALILAALRSPVVRNRYLAVKALEDWDLSSWGKRLIDEVVRLSEIEPDETVMEHLRNLRSAKGI